jgi:hypothetical protein
MLLVIHILVTLGKILKVIKQIFINIIKTYNINTINNSDDDDMPEIVSSTPLDDNYKNSNSNNLFHGSDLSTLDKDFIFEGK